MPKKYCKFFPKKNTLNLLKLKRTDDLLINNQIKPKKCSITSDNLIENPNFTL